jgi:hypothetical protein
VVRPQLVAVVDPETAHRAVDVRLDSAHRELELVGDLRVREPAGDQRDELRLARGQRLEPSIAGAIPPWWTRSNRRRRRLDWSWTSGVIGGLVAAGLMYLASRAPSMSTTSSSTSSRPICAADTDPRHRG